MIDWTASMGHTYEFYKVDPETWKDEEMIAHIEQCTINRDSSNATLGSASIDCSEVMDEGYVRVYLIATQNGYPTRVPLGTFLVQTPSVGFDGKKKLITLDAYTPLIELKGNRPPLGYTILKKEEIMPVASTLCRENLRAPVIESDYNKKLEDHFVANLEDTWLTYISDLISNAKYQFDLDELGQVLFEPVTDIGSMQHVWEYNDGNSSILYPEIDDDRDLYNIPNVVEVVYSTSTGYMTSRVVNNDKNSPTSTVNRGREVLYRDTNPSVGGNPTQQILDDYAKQLLRNLSCLEHTIKYKHGYCPVRVGDCVLLNYTRAGIVNVKAKVISQTIKCTTGCPVEETAVYTTQLWR